MRILVTGAGGLLGREITARKQSGFEIIGLSHGELDVTNPKSIESALLWHKPDAIVNCAVVVNIDVCEKDGGLCFAVNRDGVANVLTAIKKIGRPTTFVQVSSSEVFGRVKEGEYKIEGYKEDDKPMPVTNYQKSKAEAESIVVEFGGRNPDVLPNWFIFLAAWLYGKATVSFFASPSGNYPSVVRRGGAGVGRGEPTPPQLFEEFVKFLGPEKFTNFL